jgi:hypothetical protein
LADVIPALPMMNQCVAAGLGAIAALEVVACDRFGRSWPGVRLARLPLTEGEAPRSAFSGVRSPVSVAMADRAGQSIQVIYYAFSAYVLCKRSVSGHSARGYVKSWALRFACTTNNLTKAHHMDGL